MGNRLENGLIVVNPHFPDGIPNKAGFEYFYFKK